MTFAPARVAARVKAVQNPAGSTTPSRGLYVNKKKENKHIIFK